MHKPIRVALATCADFPTLEEPERLVIAPLKTRGIDGIPAVWDDPDVDWASFALIVLRGTWDYPDKIDAFRSWLESVEQVTRLANPAVVVGWNTDKRYLAELDEAGIPIVPTTFLDPAIPDDAGLSIAQLLARCGAADAREYVVKPAVSAGSRDTARYVIGSDDAVALDHVARLLAAGRVVMIQPYLDSVDTRGETALLFLGGEYSHAIRKGPLLQASAAPTQELFAQEDISPRTPSSAELAIARQVMDLVVDTFGTLAYARVDLLDAADGRPVVLELELTEPSLFIETNDDAPARLAAAIEAQLPPR